MRHLAQATEKWEIWFQKAFGIYKSRPKPPADLILRKLMTLMKNTELETSRKVIQDLAQKFKHSRSNLGKANGEIGTLDERLLANKDGAVPSVFLGRFQDSTIQLRCKIVPSNDAYVPTGLQNHVL